MRLLFRAVYYSVVPLFGSFVDRRRDMVRWKLRRQIKHCMAYAKFSAFAYRSS